MRKLIKSAKNNKVLHIDTAFSYGNAHKELGKIGVKKFKVTTKLPILSMKTKNLEKKITNLIISIIKIFLSAISKYLLLSNSIPLELKLGIAK